MSRNIYLRLQKFQYVKSAPLRCGIDAADKCQMTVNLKKVELPVKQIVSGKVVKPSGTLLNPKSLDYYYQFAEVERPVGPKSKL